MILAAGRGERMRPLTDRIPKCLLEVGGKPLIFRHLEKLAGAGFGTVVINHAHLGAQIEAAVGDGSKWNMRIRFSPELEALETAGGIHHALPLLHGPAFAVVNADVYSTYDYANLVLATRRMQPGVLAHLVLVANPPHHLDGDFSLEADRVRAGGKKKLTFSGIGVYRPALFDELIPGGKHPLAPLLLKHMALGKISGEYFAGEWDDVGSPQRLAELETRLARNQER
jgi:N-acetyl-alpha-D-muramate 1-phosphate uridylyltransferase